MPPPRPPQPARRPNSRRPPYRPPGSQRPAPAPEPNQPWYRKIWVLVGVPVLVAVLGGVVVAKSTDLFNRGLDRVGADIQVLDVSPAEDTGSDWIVPADVDPLPFNYIPHSDRLTWLRERGGIPVRSMRWTVTVKAERTSAVQIVNIVPVLVEPCTSPRVAGYGFMEEHSEGAGDDIVLTADVSALRPRFDRTGADEKGERIDVDDFFSGHHVALPKDEKNTIVLETKVAAGHCRWTYRIEYIADSGRESISLTAPGGKPFEATALGDFKDYAWIMPGYSLRCASESDQIPPRPKLTAAQYGTNCWG
ncbi:hypothetical protein [Nocardia sp. NPDC051832]|uniref:hypothetical protein n=1 Tax=Nocardia sp. NPDC051832 TaxID=3155673 RepID=UPI00342164C4